MNTSFTSVLYEVYDMHMYFHHNKTAAADGMILSVPLQSGTIFHTYFCQFAPGSP